MTRRLQVTLKWAQTIDGQLADDRDQSQWISGPEERRYTHLVRSRHDAVLVGAQTFLKDLCQLTVREGPVPERQPVRVIFDPRGRLFESVRGHPRVAAALRSGLRKTYVLSDVFEDHRQEELSELVPGLVVISYRLGDFSSWLEGVLYLFARKFVELEKRELRTVMVEGGASTLALFLKAGLADAIEVAISPLILGGKRHRIEMLSLLSNVDRFELESQEQFGPDVVLRYATKRQAPRKELL